MVDLRHVINVVACKLTGYLVVKASRLAPARRSPRADEDTGQSRRERQLSQELAVRRRREERESRARRLLDPQAHEVIERVGPRTMTGYDKLYGLVLACRHIARHDVPGGVVECGVWRGGSMQAIALSLLGAGDRTRHLHLYDTFEGMPPPTDVDRRVLNRRPAAQMLEEKGRDHPVWGVALIIDDYGDWEGSAEGRRRVLRDPRRADPAPAPGARTDRSQALVARTSRTDPAIPVRGQAQHPRARATPARRGASPALPAPTPGRRTGQPTARHGWWRPGRPRRPAAGR
jgi:hypothetical protein